MKKKSWKENTRDWSGGSPSMIKHEARDTVVWSQQFNVLEWPSQSIDLNPAVYRLCSSNATKLVQKESLKYPLA